tara:strand:- start:1272 stop:2549 length:1278 start_codon:yes stop_codon:yes gene_type:complete
MPLHGVAATPPPDLSPETIEYVRSIVAEEMHAEPRDLTPSPEADTGFEFSGYFRAGANAFLSGGSKNGGSCFGLNYPKNDGAYYRLGNECRDYAEFAFSHVQQVNDIKIAAVWMMDIAGDSRGPTTVEPWSRRTRQLYVEAEGLLPTGNLWVGRRYYRTQGFGDIHMFDAFYMQSSGNGFGVTDIELGDDNSLHLAAFLNSDVEEPISDSNVLLFDARNEIGLGDTGDVVLGLQFAQNDGGPDGITATFEFQKTIGMLEQKTVLQYGTGIFAENPGCMGTDGGCYNLTADSGDDNIRIFNTGLFNISPAFKVNYLALYENSDAFHELKSIGIRPHFMLSKYWSVLAEVGMNIYEKEGMEEQELMKYTLALQASTDAGDYWARPALRFYVSSFDWNDAATAQSGLVRPEGNETDALVAGVQTEIWF